MNKKGFTVIELIISFAFVSALTASLFTLVMNYKEKTQYASDIVGITNFKNIISTVVQRDIETKILKKVEYCKNAGVVINRCVEFQFQDGTSKQLQVVYTEETATVHTSSLTYYKYYIIYDEVLYRVPAEGNIEIRADYMLNYTTLDDAIENKIGLYRVNLTFYHKNMDINAELNIVGVGEGFAKPVGGGGYVSYAVGTPVTVVLNSGCDEDGNCTQDKKEDFFHVIIASDKYDNKVTLLADSTYGNSKMFETSHISPLNTFEDSQVYNVLSGLYNEWTSIDQRSDIRLITASELALLSESDLSVILYNAPTSVSLGALNKPKNQFLKANEKIVGGTKTDKEFWTSTNYLTEGTQDSMWIYDKGYLVKSKMDVAHYIRPVIRVNKGYVLERVDS